MRDDPVISASRTFHHGQYSVIFFVNKAAHLSVQGDEDALDEVTLESDLIASKITESFQAAASEMPFWKVRDESSEEESWLYPYVTCDFQGSEFREQGLAVYDVTIAAEFSMSSKDLVAFRNAVMVIGHGIAAASGAVVEFIAVQEYTEHRVSETRRPSLD